MGAWENSDKKPKASGTERAASILRQTVEAGVRRMTKEFNIVGKEHIPKGGCLVVSNHSSHADGHILVAALAGEDIGVSGDVSALPIVPKNLARKSGFTFFTAGSVQHLSDSDKAALNPNSLLGKSISRHRDPKLQGADTLLNLTALYGLVNNIIAGKKVIFFPEGHFFRKNDGKLRTTTRGVDSIAKIYKQKTGEDLVILPTGIAGAADVGGADPDSNPLARITDVAASVVRPTAVVKVTFGEPFTLPPDADFNPVFRERVGALLPEEYR